MVVVIVVVGVYNTYDGTHYNDETHSHFVYGLMCMCVTRAIRVAAKTDAACENGVKTPAYTGGSYFTLMKPGCCCNRGVITTINEIVAKLSLTILPRVK